MFFDDFSERLVKVCDGRYKIFPSITRSPWNGMVVVALSTFKPQAGPVTAERLPIEALGHFNSERADEYITYLCRRYIGILLDRLLTRFLPGKGETGGEPKIEEKKNERKKRRSGS